jgi:hypothetical protein
MMKPPGVMAAWYDVGDPVERPGVLAAGEAEAGVGDRLAVRLVAELGLERHTVVDEPVVVGDRALAVGPHLVGVRVGAAGGEQEPLHVLGGVVEPERLLDRRAATEVDETARQGRGAAGTAGPLEGHDVCSGLGGADRGAGPGDAETDHGDVGLEVPDVDAARVERGDGAGVLAHSFVMTSSANRASESSFTDRSFGSPP